MSTLKSLISTTESIGDFKITARMVSETFGKLLEQNRSAEAISILKDIQKNPELQSGITADDVAKLFANSYGRETSIIEYTAHAPALKANITPEMVMQAYRKYAQQYWSEDKNFLDHIKHDERLSSPLPAKMAELFAESSVMTPHGVFKEKSIAQTILINTKENPFFRSEITPSQLATVYSAILTWGLKSDWFLENLTETERADPAFGVLLSRHFESGQKSAWLDSGLRHSVMALAESQKYPEMQSAIAPERIAQTHQLCLRERYNSHADAIATIVKSNEGLQQALPEIARSLAPA